MRISYLGSNQRQTTTLNTKQANRTSTSEEKTSQRLPRWPRQVQTPIYAQVRVLARPNPTHDRRALATTFDEVSASLKSPSFAPSFSVRNGVSGS